MKKKILPLLLTFLLAFGMLPATTFANEDGQAHDFADMPNNWSTAALKKAVENELLKGYTVSGKKLINANAPLKRAEMAAVVNRAFGAVKTAELNGVTDVASKAWYASDMAKAVMMGTFMKDTKMRPESNITRQEAFVVLARAFKVSSDTAENKALANYSDQNRIAAWAKKDINAMLEAGYVQGSDGKLNPNANISRAEFATVMDNLVKQYIDIPGDVTDISTSGNVLIRVPGVTLKDLTIKGDLIIADGVGEGDVTLDNVKVEGRTVVRGGGENSVIIKGNSDLSKVIVCKVDGKVRISIEGEADVEVIYVDDGSDDVLIKGSIGTLEVAGDNITAFATDANLTKAVVSGDHSTIILRDKSNMKEGNITGNASKIIVENGATADKITISGSNAKVEGNGTVKDVEVKADGDNASITTPNTKIEAAKGAEGVTAAGGAPVDSGTSATNNNTGTWIVTPPRSGGGSGAPAPSVVAAINISTDVDVTGGVDNDAVVTVTLTTATSGADIYYTTDDSTPTDSSTKYTAPFAVDTDNIEGETVTIKAIGIKTGYTNSAVVEKGIVFKPASISVTAIRVSSNPAKISYYEGQSLDLTGLRVELTYSDNSTEYVQLGDFTTKGITTDPVDGTILSIAEHNDTRISVSCNGKSAQSGDKLSVLAATPSEFAGGDGTTANPYQVATAEQLDNVRNHLDKYFIQTANIDLAEYLADGGAGYNDGAGWMPIGNSTSFIGNYNGNGKSISNLKVERYGFYIGLFGQNEGTIRNVSLSEVDIKGKASVGGLIGINKGGTVANSSVTGSIYSSNGGDNSYVGGLIGYIDGGQISGCYSSATVSAPSGDKIGGLIGSNKDGGESSITNCYATGAVTGINNIGGLVGANYSSNEITNSYAIGAVAGTGYNVGGLIGYNGGTVTNSYWDTQTSGLTSSTGGTSKTTAEMTQQSTFADWDFDSVWQINADPASYPYLQWQGNENIPYPDNE
ncbi:MAG TPA: hypothetical protein GXZ70_03045 [Clostridiales bacterium]|nr:hypothetical protein [Clostridiales bacterium]